MAYRCPTRRNWTGQLSLRLLSEGYLESPDGTDCRFIPGLPVIGRDANRLRVRILWKELPPPYTDKIAVADCRTRGIWLAPDLYERPGYSVRYTIGCTLGICAIGLNDTEEAREWRRRQYGPSLDRRPTNEDWETLP